MSDGVRFVCAGSLGPVGMCSQTAEEPRGQDLHDDDFDPSDAEALGDHVIAQMNQARVVAAN